MRSARAAAEARINEEKGVTNRRRAAIQAIDDEKTAVRSANIEKMRLHDEGFARRMNFLDEEEKARIGAIQAEIDAIEKRTRLEDEERREREYLREGENVTNTAQKTLKPCDLGMPPFLR